MSKHGLLTALSVLASTAAVPATGEVRVFSDEAAFDAAVANATTYTPVQDAFFASTYNFGPVIATAPFFDTYTGDYGPGVRSLGAFLSPVVYSSTHTALGLNLGYYIGPQTATYTIDGITGTINVPDNAATPNSVFIGFVDTAPINVSFDTDSAEFDTLRVISADGAVPEPASWAMMIGGFGLVGGMMRAARRSDRRFTRRLRGANA